MRLTPFISALIIISLGTNNIEAQDSIPDANRASATTLRWNKGRGYAPFRYATHEGISINNETSLEITDFISLPIPTSSLNLSFRAANLHSHPRKRYTYRNEAGREFRSKYPSWSFYLTFSDHSRLTIEIKTAEEGNDFDSHATTEIIISTSDQSFNERIIPIRQSPLLPYAAINLWNLTLRDSKLYLYGGSHSVSSVWTGTFPGKECTGFGFCTSPGALLSISDISLENLSSNPTRRYLSTDKTESLLSGLNKSNDALEGIWTIFDRDLEESSLRLGGDYRLAIVRDGDHYIILYLSGALINKNEWEQGMVKAILTPKEFKGIYSVEWIDAEWNTVSRAVVAQEEERGVLAIQFPYHNNSTVRLRKVPTSSPK